MTDLAQKSPRGARHAQIRIQEIVTLLLRYPFAGQLTSKGRSRRLAAYPYPYLIFYRVTDDEVVIHGVRLSARNPASMP